MTLESHWSWLPKLNSPDFDLLRLSIDDGCKYLQCLPKQQFFPYGQELVSESCLRQSCGDWKCDLPKNIVLSFTPFASTLPFLKCSILDSGLDLWHRSKVSVLLSLSSSPLLRANFLESFFSCSFPSPLFSPLEGSTHSSSTCPTSGGKLSWPITVACLAWIFTLLDWHLSFFSNWSVSSICLSSKVISLWTKMKIV